MSWSPGVGVEVSVALDIGSQQRVDLSVNQADHGGCLTVGTIAEITLEPAHLETLRDQRPACWPIWVWWTRPAAAPPRRIAARWSWRTTCGTRRPWRTGPASGNGPTGGTLNAARSALDSVLAAVDSAARVADDASEDARRLLDRQHP